MRSGDHGGERACGSREGQAWTARKTESTAHVQGYGYPVVCGTEWRCPWETSDFFPQTKCGK